MNKKVVTIGCLSLALLMGGTTFTSCSNDDEPSVTYPVDKDLAGNYLGKLEVTMGSQTSTYSASKVTISKGSKDNTITLGLKDFSYMGMTIGDITLSDIPLTETSDGSYTFKGEPTTKIGSLGEMTIVTSGTIGNGKLSVNLDISSAGVKVNFSGNKLTGSESSEAKILSFSFDESNADNSIVLIQPTINDDNTITFSVSKDATDDQLKKLVPTITVSEGATVTPATDVAQDFTKPVTYTVIAADGTKVTYTIKTDKNVSATSYDFETWGQSSIKYSFTPENSTPIDDENVKDPQGWGSSNPGAYMLKAFYQTGKGYVVSQADGVVSGKSAAKIETIETPTADGNNIVPRITTGSLFLGNFIIDLTNTLNSTKFGIPYEETTKYPIALKGYFKYQAGSTYYTVEGPNYRQNCHNATVDKDKKDKGNISVVLYETTAWDTKGWTDCLTGTDEDQENNIKTSSRIVAVGSMDIDDQADWKEFTLPINFLEGKNFDATKKYRLAISCSSSYQGDKFWGAPGSTLWVDDFELIYKDVK